MVLSEIAKTLEREGIETEILQLAPQPVWDCIGCNHCQSTVQCVFDEDVVNSQLKKAVGVTVLLTRYPESSKTTEDGSNPIPVTYFSAAESTQPLAEVAADIQDADLYKIVSENPYTSENMNYGNSSSNITQEQNDPTARPAISDSVSNMGQYDVISLGHPIWARSGAPDHQHLLEVPRFYR